LYYVKDHLGSIRVTVDSTGNVVSSDDYDRACPPIFLAEGMQLEGRSANYGSANEKYKFTGKERDVETGYDYFGARYYDSRIGRWMSVDPLTEKYPNISPYNYCANNPNSFVDPDGAIIVNTHSVQSYQYAQVQNMLSVIQTTTVGKQLYDYLNSIPQEIKISIGEVPPNKWNEGFGNIYVNDKSFEFTGADITIDYSDLNVYGNKYITPFGYDVFNTLIHELSHAKLAAECYSLWLALNDSEVGSAILNRLANADMAKYIKETGKKKRNQQNNSNVKSETKNEDDEFDDQESTGRTWDRSPGNIRYLHSQQYNGQ
jgi:RHS repeat-associated protein